LEGIFGKIDFPKSTLFFLS